LKTLVRTKRKLIIKRFNPSPPSPPSPPPLPPLGANSKSPLPTAEYKKGRRHRVWKTLVRTKRKSIIKRFKPSPPSPPSPPPSPPLGANSKSPLRHRVLKTLVRARNPSSSRFLESVDHDSDERDENEMNEMRMK
jgi:hypothetical protein